ncbi:MAG: MFS transporter [Campylobacteraceae bacterium]|nr:MFS transporter [Campylobacteraceae bacterium]
MLFFNISAFYYFYFSATAVYVIFMPKVLLDVGYSASEIGILYALAPLMRFLTPFLFLKLIKLDAKVFKIALACSTIATSSFYFTLDNFYAFMFTNALLGVSLSLILPYIEIIALKDLGKERYGKSRLFGSIGFMVIALVLAKFLSSPFIALHFFLFANIATVILSLILLKHDVSHDDAGSKKPFSFFKYWPFWVSLFFMQMSFGSFYNFFTIYETEHGVSLETVSYLWSFGILCEIVMLYFQGPLLKRNLKNILLFCLSLTVIRWMILFLFPESLFLTYVTQGMHAFSFGLYHSSVIIFLYTLYDNKKLAQQFMYGVAYGLGGFIGALLAGYLYGEYLFLSSAFFAACSLFFMSKVNKQV